MHVPMVSGWHKLTRCDLSEKQISIDLGPMHPIFDIDEATGAVLCIHTKEMCFCAAGGDAEVAFCAPNHGTDPIPGSIRLISGELYKFQVSHGDRALASSDTPGTALLFWNT
jgi:hypothetical protein